MCVWCSQDMSSLFSPSPHTARCCNFSCTSTTCAIADPWTAHTSTDSQHYGGFHLNVCTVYTILLNVLLQKRAQLPSAAAMAWLCAPIASPVVSSPNTRNGCADAWYLTSLATGSGIKYLICAYICKEMQWVVTFVKTPVQTYYSHGTYSHRPYSHDTSAKYPQA